jgi:hypothetical protein
MRQVCDGGDFLPARLSELIECNPMFAVDVLSRILTANGPRVNEFVAFCFALLKFRAFGSNGVFLLCRYLQAILATSLSLHSLDVVNRLLSLSNGNHSASTKSLLSPEFLAQFISHCLQACDSAKDKYMQARLVRLVCVFVQALLRNDQHAALQVLEYHSFCEFLSMECLNVHLIARTMLPCEPNFSHSVSLTLEFEKPPRCSDC